MTRGPLELKVLGQRLAVCRLPYDAGFPEWAAPATFCSITRTDDELSVVVTESCVPGDVTAERGWRALQVRGPLDFSEVGVLASLAAPLAESGVSLFAISTYDTDYILVRATDLGRAVDSLGRAGLSVEPPA